MDIFTTGKTPLEIQTQMTHCPVVPLLDRRHLGCFRLRLGLKLVGLPFCFGVNTKVKSNEVKQRTVLTDLRMQRSARAINEANKQTKDTKQRGLCVTQRELYSFRPLYSLERTVKHNLRSNQPDFKNAKNPSHRSIVENFDQKVRA